jgi:hypothetical protein
LLGRRRTGRMRYPRDRPKRSVQFDNQAIHADSLPKKKRAPEGARLVMRLRYD